MNGLAGIAVGMATNMPPHNLSEIAMRCSSCWEPEGDPDELILLRARPRLPHRRGDRRRWGYSRLPTPPGRGLLRLRGKAQARERDGKDEIIITEIPYEVNKSQLLQLMADLVRDKRIDGVSDLRDESDRHGMSIVVELKRDVPAEIVLNRIYEHTPLETTFGVINLCLVDGRRRSWASSPCSRSTSSTGGRSLTRRTKFDLARTWNGCTCSKGSSSPSTTSTR